MCINNTSHLIYPIKRSSNRKLFIGNTKFTLGRTKIANFNSAKTFKIANSQTLISVNFSSFTVSPKPWTLGVRLSLGPDVNEFRGTGGPESCPVRISFYSE